MDHKGRTIESRPCKLQSSCKRAVDDQGWPGHLRAHNPLPPHDYKRVSTGLHRYGSIARTAGSPIGTGWTHYALEVPTRACGL